MASSQQIVRSHQPFAKKDQARGRTLQMKWLQDVAQCENCKLAFVP
jgi:hypothetical protein